MTAGRPADWHPTRALAIAVTFSVATLFLAAVLHRPDVLALGLPVLALLIAQLLRPVSGPGRATLRARPAALREGQQTALDLLLQVDPAADFAVARVRPGRLLRLRRATHATQVVVAREHQAVSVGARALRWGRTRSGTATVTVCAGHGMFRQVEPARDSAVTVIPIRQLFEAVDAVPHTSGVVGAHSSRRPGEGSDLATLRPFVPGDRLRRINWPVSQRTGTLHVTATYAEQDTAVVLVIDSSVDVAARDGSVTGGTIDLAVHAAASIAEFYLRHGDRVGLIDTARADRPVAPAGGRAHLDRIVHHLLDTVAGRPAREVALPRVIARFRARALVILLSPLLAPARPDLAAELARSGLHVIVVDTLSPEPPQDLQGESGELAYRMALLRRQVDIDRLAGHGVPVVAWQGANSLDEVLRGVARAARIPRLRA